jgi:hypothetical protein
MYAEKNSEHQGFPCLLGSGKATAYSGYPAAQDARAADFCMVRNDVSTRYEPKAFLSQMPQS